MTKLCGCSFAFGPHPLEIAASIVSELGFTTMDLGASLVNTQVNPILASESPVELAEKVRSTADANGLDLNECFVLDFGEPINHPEASVRSSVLRRLRGLAKFARLSGCRSVMFIPGVVHPELGERKSFDLSIRVLREMVKVAQDEGIPLNIEPCEPSVAQTPWTARDLCHEVPGLGLTLDYSHFIDQGFPQLGIEDLHEFARHLHARQAAPGKRVETVQAGTVDFKRILSVLNNQHYRGYIAVEYVECPQTTACGVDVIAETRQMKTLLEKLLIEQRTL